MIVQVKWERRPFWSGQAQIYALNYLLHIGVMLNIKKVFIILFLFWLWEQETTWQFLNQIIKLSFQLSVQIYSLLGQTEGERKALFGGYKKGTTLWDYHQEHLVVIRNEKVSTFAKFETILPLLCILLEPLTNKHCRTWRSMVNLCIYCTTCQR